MHQSGERMGPKMGVEFGAILVKKWPKSYKTPPWEALGAPWGPIGGRVQFWTPFADGLVTHFGALLALFATFWKPFFDVFLGTLPEGALGEFGAQRPPKWEALGGHFDDFSEEPPFLDFGDRFYENRLFLRSGGVRFGSIFVTFLEVFSRRSPGADFARFWPILRPKGRPIWLHLATFGLFFEVRFWGRF